MPEIVHSRGSIHVDVNSISTQNIYMGNDFQNLGPGVIIGYTEPTANELQKPIYKYNISYKTTDISTYGGDISLNEAYFGTIHGALGGSISAPHAFFSEGSCNSFSVNNNLNLFKRSNVSQIDASPFIASCADGIGNFYLLNDWGDIIKYNPKTDGKTLIRQGSGGNYIPKNMGCSYDGSYFYLGIQNADPFNYDPSYLEVIDKYGNSLGRLNYSYIGYSGGIAVSKSGKIYTTDPIARNVITFYYPDTLNNPTIQNFPEYTPYSIAIDKNDHVYFTSGSQIYCVDTEHVITIDGKYQPDLTNGLVVDNNLNIIFADSYNRRTVSLTSNGTYNYTIKTDTNDDYPSPVYISMTDKDELLLLGVNGSIKIYKSIISSGSNIIIWADYFTGDGSGITNIQPSSITQPFTNLVVSNTQPRPPFAPSYYISKHLDNPDSGMRISGSGQVAAYNSSTIVVVRSSNVWQYPESVGADGSVRSISYDGNTILYVSYVGYSALYYKVTYTGTTWGAPQQIQFETQSDPIMSSDGSFVAARKTANVVVSNNYTTFSNIHVPSARSIAFTDAAKQIAILNSDGTSVSIWDNKNPWTLNNSLTVSGGTNISISGDGTVLYVNENSYTSNVFRYNGGSEWTLELTVPGSGYISGDGKVCVSDVDIFKIYYNTNLSTWINILTIRNSVGDYISSISSNGQVFLISDLNEGSNIYSITLPYPVYSQDAIQTSGFSVSSNGLVTASAIHSGGFSVQSAVANTYTEVTIPASGGTSVSYDGHWTAFGNYVSKTVRIYKDGVQFGSTLTSSETYFGAFVSLNRDGTLLAVGGPFGKVYTYTRTQTGWNQSRVIDTGLSIVYKPSLSGDGTRVILGTYYADGGSKGQSDNVSIVYAYNTVSGHLDWSVNFNGNNGQISTAISDDGETVVVAIPELQYIYIYNYGDTNPVETIYHTMFADPSISTNGNTIVFVSGDQKIYVYNRVG